MIPFREILCFHDTLPKNTLYYYTNIICGEIQYLLKKTCGRTRTDERTSLRRRVAAERGTRKRHAEHVTIPARTALTF